MPYSKSSLSREKTERALTSFPFIPLQNVISPPQKSTDILHPDTSFRLAYGTNLVRNRYQDVKYLLIPDESSTE